MCAGELRILIIGRVKTGKSILGNNIVGTTTFQVGTDLSFGKPTTREPTEASAEISGRTIKVVDTSSLSTLNHEGKKEEVDKWKKMTAPGPSAILFLVRCDRIKDEDYDFYKEVKQLWGEEDSFRHRLIVVLTFEDKLGSTPVEAKLKEKKNENLNTIIDEAGRRYILVNNDGPKRKRPDYIQLIVDKLKQQA